MVWQLVVGHVHREYTGVAEKYMGEAKKEWYFQNVLLLNMLAYMFGRGLGEEE